MTRVVRIMPVCTGNICRSAMAGIVLKVAAQELGLLDSLEIASSGVSDEEQGNKMDYRAIQVLRAHGYDVSDPLVKRHRAHKITPSEIESYDLLLPMTTGHARVLVNFLGADPSKVYMWRWFENEKDNHLNAPDLADPWYGGIDDFEEALDQLESSAKKIVDFALQPR